MITFTSDRATDKLFLESIAFALDVERRSVMEEPVQDRGGEHVVLEDLAPVEKSLVARDDEARSLVAADEEPEEEARLLPREGEIAQLIKDQHLGIYVLLERAVEPILMPGPDEAGHELLEGEKEDGVTTPVRLTCRPPFVATTP